MLKLWYNFTIKESVDKPRFFHQLIPMEVEYECGVLDVRMNFTVQRRRYECVVTMITDHRVLYLV